MGRKKIDYNNISMVWKRIDNGLSTKLTQKEELKIKLKKYKIEKLRISKRIKKLTKQTKELK